jgi:FixJ family two-component response regulator
MPLVDGVALGRRIALQWPWLRLLYMSAHPAQVLAEHGLADLEVVFLAKPFTHGELLEKVQRALDRRSSPRRSEAMEESVRDHG